MRPRKRKTQPWESSVSGWMKRHEIPEEKIEPFIHFLFRKKIGWELAAIKEILRMKEEARPNPYKQ